MIDKEQIIKVIDFWQKVAKESILHLRWLLNKIKLKGDEIVDITGPRRSGKSSVLRFLSKNLQEEGSWLYLNFEDPFFIQNNQAQTIEEFIDVYREYFSPHLHFLFFDEVHNIENWEKAVRKLHESSSYKIFVTGSSSKLLSRELSSLITGRHISFELMPLNFQEYLRFKNIKIEDKKDIILRKTKIIRYFDKYLKLGGFPKIVLEENEELLKQYYSDILEKDIIKRYDIRQKMTLEKMGVYLLTNAAKPLSISSLAHVFDISFEIASIYSEYFKEAFLIFEVPQFSYSLKTQQKALKKIYAVDTGLANAISFRFSEDKGRVFENCIYLQLKKLPAKIFYHRTKNNLEVDFLLQYKKNQIELIQACYDLDDEKTKQREIKALTEAMEELSISTGLILTKTTKDSLKIKGKTIRVLPSYEWALGL